MFGSMGQTNVKNLGNGGTMDGDVTITGDLTVSGGISLTLNEVLQGTSTIDVNNTEALLVRKDSDGGDVFIVDTTNTRVGVGVTPTTPMHIKVDNSTTDTTNGLLIEQDGAGDAVAQFLLTGTKRYMMGIDNSDSDNFVIMTGASDLSSGNRLTFDSDMSATFPNKIGIGNTAEVDFHIKLADTANARIEDTSADGIAKLDFKNDQRQATIGVYGDDSDNFKIDHGGGAVLTINTAQNIGIGTTSPQKKVDIVQVYSTGGSSNEDLQLLIRGGNADLDPTGDSIGLGFGYGSANNYVKSGIVHEFTSANGSGTLHFCTSSVSGADTINKGDSRMSINSAGNVTMSGTLTVNGDLAKVSGSHPALQLEDSDDSNFGEIGYSDGVLSFTTNGGDEAGASDTMVFYNHGSTQRMKLLSNGSLQIGTAGNATDVPLMVNNKILIHQDSGGAGDSELTFDRRHDGAVARIQAKAGASGAMGTELHFVTKLAGGSEGTALVLDDNQKAGIGIATPDTLLHIFKADASQTAHSDSLFTIENSGGTYMTILSGATSHGQIHFGDSGQNDDGVVGYDQATNKFYVLTNHSTTKKFQVDANGSSTFQATADTTVATFKGFEGNNGTIEIHADEGDDNADQWRISANTSGELGIGTYSSGSWVNAIQFNSDAHIKTPLKLSEDSGATSIEFIPASGQASEVKFFQDDGSTQDARIFAPEGAQDLAFEAGTTEMMRITTTAVGIGVTPEADWLSTRTALQIGGSGAIFGATSAGAGGTLNVGQNVYFHSGGSYRRIDEDEVTSWSVLFDPAIASKYEDCGIAMLDAPSEVMEIALKYVGKDPNTEDENDYKAALSMLQEIRPFIRYFDSSQYIDDLANGEICLAMGWSGDVFIAAYEEIEPVWYSIPSEGTVIWFDMMAIPADAKNVLNAHKFINYILRPEVAADITNYVWYSNPNKAANELVDPEILGDPAIYPDEATLSMLFADTADSPKKAQLSTKYFNKFKSN